VADVQLHTPLPRTDSRVAPHAPVLGAMTLPRVQYAEEVSGEVPGSPVHPSLRGDPTEPVPETLLGLGTTVVSGGLTGGLAAGSWRGAAIGSGVTVGAWGLWNLIGSWRQVGTTTRLLLGLSSLVGSTLATVLVLERRTT